GSEPMALGPPVWPGRRGFGWRNIAPPSGPRKANSRYSLGVYRRVRSPDSEITCASLQAPRLTLPSRATYHPPDVERAPPGHRAIGAFACLLGSMTDGTPRPDGEDRAQAR